MNANPMYPLKPDSWQPTEYFLEKVIFKKELRDNLEIHVCEECKNTNFKCQVCGEWNSVLNFYKDVDFIVCRSCKTPYKIETSFITEISLLACEWCSEEQDDCDDYEDEEEDDCDDYEDYEDYEDEKEDEGY